MATPVMVTFTSVAGPPGLVPCSGAQEGDKVLTVVIVDGQFTGSNETHLFGHLVPADGYLVNTTNVATAVGMAAVLLRG